MSINRIKMNDNANRKRINKRIEYGTLCFDNASDLTERELYLLIQIMYHVDNDNIIRNVYGESMTNIDDVSNVIGLRGQNMVLRELTKKSVLKKLKFGRIYAYAVNPYVCYRGRSVHRDVYMGFKDSKYRYVYGEDYFEEVLV